MLTTSCQSHHIALTINVSGAGSEDSGVNVAYSALVVALNAQSVVSLQRIHMLWLLLSTNRVVKPQGV